MLYLILWYLVVSFLGLLSFPLAYRLLPALPDRGYAFSRSIGLLLWGYIFWLLASLGVLRNDSGGLLLALIVIVALSLWSWRSIPKEEFRKWFFERRRMVIIVEFLFLLAFAAWAFVRSANPEIAGTEKPMELAFINAILHSPKFPPHDPWLAGYAISYYYFGYVLIAILAKLTATTGSVAFNLGLSLVFALSAVGAYGLIYNLLEARHVNRGPLSTTRHSSLVSLFGPFFLLIVSNLEGFFHSLHTRGVLWSTNATGQLTSSFWQWLDIKDLSQPPTQPFGWMPTQFWWWWRASRVVQDYDLLHRWKEIIDEFPFFSFLLGDLHPHVLAMPFALLAIALAFNLFLGGGRGHLKLLRQHLVIHPIYFLFSALALGGMAFLNIWDFPIYVVLFCGAYILGRMQDWRLGWKNEDQDQDIRRDGISSSLTLRSIMTLSLKEFLLLGLALGVSGVVLYLPFYLGFSSQAGGVLPNLVYPTRGAHLWVMFGSLLIPIFAFIIFLWKRNGDTNRLKNGLTLSLGIMVALFLLAVLFGWGITRLPILGEIFLDSIGAKGEVAFLFQEVFLGRFIYSGGWITLLTLLGLSMGLLWPTARQVREEQESSFGDQDLLTREQESDPREERSVVPDTHLFTLLLILLGTLIVIFPEFFYLRDLFGTRMNTIFKFYYQAWIVWSIAAAYGTLVLLQKLRGKWLVGYSLGITVVLGAAMFYPVMGLWTKTNGFKSNEGLTLDGGVFYERQEPDEVAAINWLSKAPPGVVVEAVGGSYTGFARVSTYTGQSTVLGWPGHEDQWRGSRVGWVNRQADVETIYRSNDWAAVQELFRKYEVRYIFLGSLERQTYGVSDDKFQRYLTPVFQQGQVSIYEVP